MTGTTTTREDSKVLNETIMSKLASGDPTLEKQALDAVNDYTRTTMREDGFHRKIQEYVPVRNDQLTRQIDTDKPVVIVDKEPSSPAAQSIPFATLPDNLYIRAPRYPVQFDRIVTSRFTKDNDELRTWEMDIRQVISDNAIKDMLAEEDGKFILAVNTAIVGQGLTVPTSGTVQHEAIPGGITRDTWQDSMKIVPNTPSSLGVKTILINHITIYDVMKWGRDEMGGDWSQDLMRNGWTETSIGGKDLIITIKKGLVPTNTAFQFADNKFIGKAYELEQTTLYIKRNAFMLEFFAYETIGGTIGHTSGIGRADFE